jgi:hypothetical protein
MQAWSKTGSRRLLEQFQKRSHPHDIFSLKHRAVFQSLIQKTPHHSIESGNPEFPLLKSVVPLRKSALPVEIKYRSIYHNCDGKDSHSKFSAEERNAFQMFFL